MEASKRAAAAHKAAREKDAKILEQLQASKKELQQPPDNTNSKTDWTLWIVGGFIILAVGWYGYLQYSSRKQVMVASKQVQQAPPEQSGLQSYASAWRTANPFSMA